MRFKLLTMMAIAFLQNDKNAQKTLKETGSKKEAFKGTMFEYVNLGNNPIYIPSKSQQIKRKRMLARK